MLIQLYKDTKNSLNKKFKDTKIKNYQKIPLLFLKFSFSSPIEGWW
jgi:hypothetical protein